MIEHPVLLSALTQASFRAEATHTRIVPTDLLVAFDANRYSVAITSIGQTVDLPVHGPDRAGVSARDWTAVIATCGRICYQRRKIYVSQVFAGQKVGVKQTGDHIWLVTFMDYDWGYFDDETCRLEPIDNPFRPRLLPMSPEWTERKWRARRDSNAGPPAWKARRRICYAKAVIKGPFLSGCLGESPPNQEVLPLSHVLCDDRSVALVAWRSARGRLRHPALTVRSYNARRW